ncbi:MAG: endonuclease/exonuclease/phosphatase family protein [Candidatus Rifleibacteriota bacterium]
MLEKFDRKPLKKIEKALTTFKRSLAGYLINKIFFKTGVYTALSNNKTITVNRNQPNRRAKSDKSLKIITANLYLFPPPLLKEQKKRISYFVNSIKRLDPEIILLQEVWDKNSIVEIARLLPDYNLSFKTSGLYNRSGLLTLCKYKIQHAQFIPYPLSIRHKIEELLAQKGLLKTDIELDGHKISIFNTHLYSSSPRHSYRPNFNQFELLKRTVSSFSSDLKILGGDFNLKPHEIGKLIEADFLRGSCNLPTAGGIRRTKKLDYIMVVSQKPLKTRLATRRLETEQMFSDHSAVFGRIIFAGP